MPKIFRVVVLFFSRIVVCAALALPLSAAAADAHVAPVNINSASAETLADALHGVGVRKAEAIVAFREQHGPFQKPEDLTKVKGIGEATLANNLARIQVE